MRVVLDTNVVISGLIWTGPPRSLLVAILDDALTAYSSYALVSELTRKLGQSKLDSELLKRGLHASQLVASYVALCEIVSAVSLPTRISRDPG